MAYASRDLYQRNFGPKIMHRPGCSINQALIIVRQAQTTFGCVELKYLEKVCAAGMIAWQ